MKRKRRTRPVSATPAPAASLGGALDDAIALLRAERIDEAELALLAILSRWPEQPDALHFLGVLRHTQGRVDEAVALIRRALAIIPDHATAWNNLGNVQLLAGRATEAQAAYENAVRHDTDGGKGQDVAMALNNLCVLHRHQGRLDQSELAARGALEREPDFADAWYNLSLTLLKQGRVHDGLLAGSRAIALWPAHLQSRQEMIRALMLLGERERAALLLREWLAEDPDNPVAEHMLAACQGEAAPERASDAYVEQVFDAFASSFDAKLEALGYRAPELVVQALSAAAGAPTGALAIVDAGCGTGLCGPALRPYAQRLAGCDLSEGMLRRAQSRQVYDVLHKAELTYYLETQPAAFDAIISADTLCYFGALEGVFAAAQRCLRPGGWFIFTVEALPEVHPHAHVLQANGRYAHARGYLEQAMRASTLEPLAIVGEALRQESGEAVSGWLVTARRASS